MIYLAASLRNPKVIDFANKLAASTGQQVFSDWFAAGPEADDYWKKYYKERGFSYEEALKQPASQNVFNFDKKHIDLCQFMVLLMPAGKSGHLELGYHLGKGRPGYIFLDGDPDRWDIMALFATGVTSNFTDLAEWINHGVKHARAEI